MLNICARRGETSLFCIIKIYCYVINESEPRIEVFTSMHPHQVLLRVLSPSVLIHNCNHHNITDVHTLIKEEKKTDALFLALVKADHRALPCECRWLSFVSPKIDVINQLII